MDSMIGKEDKSPSLRLSFGKRVRRKPFFVLRSLLLFVLITLFPVFFAMGCRVVLWGDDIFSSNNSSFALSVGDIQSITIDAQTISAVFVTAESAISFPKGPADNSTGNVDKRFFMGQTEITNAQMVEVLQAVWNDLKFSTISGSHNFVDSTQVMWGGEVLCKLNGEILWNNSTGFSVNTSSVNNNKPARNVTWFGAVMFCNFLTMIRDGGSDVNCVYTGIPVGLGADWSTVTMFIDYTKSGYRLPLQDEWEFCARYLGTSPPVTVPTAPLDTEYLSFDYNNPTNLTWTPGYYWTPGIYISGCDTGDSSNLNVLNNAVYQYSSTSAGPLPSDPIVPEVVKSKASNQLGLYDMSGNIAEWCSDYSGGYLLQYRGGGYSNPYSSVRIASSAGNLQAEEPRSFLGFRICRTY